MSDRMEPLPADDPCIAAWEAYKQTVAFHLAKQCAAIVEDPTGVLWSCFNAGWRRAQKHAADAAAADDDRPIGAELVRRLGRLAEALKEASDETSITPERLEAVDNTADDDRPMNAELAAKLLWCRGEYATFVCQEGDGEWHLWLIRNGHTNEADEIILPTLTTFGPARRLVEALKEVCGD